MSGGAPDRFVKQYEFLEIILEAPLLVPHTSPGQTAKDAWGITWTWPEGQLGPMPVHGPDHTVVRDIDTWRDVVRAPSLERPEEAWIPAVAHAQAVNRDDRFVAAFVAPGLFEMCHHLMGVEAALMGFYDAPESMHDLIAYLTAYELEVAAQITERLRPDALFHHDDWGGQRSTFVSPGMFRTFFLEPYKKIYSYWKQRGVELVVHHSDSYAATLVPSMIEMGVDIWQGVMTTNDTPEMIRRHGPQITFMGDIDSGLVDVADWTPELVALNVEKACRRCGPRHFVPNLTQGLNFSSFPGVYEAVDEAIDRMSAGMFGT